MIGGNAGLLAVLRHVFRVLGVRLVHAEDADDAVERCADIVAHAREERGFRTARGLRFLLRFARAKQRPRKNRHDADKHHVHAGDECPLIKSNEPHKGRFGFAVGLRRVGAGGDVVLGIRDALVHDGEKRRGVLAHPCGEPDGTRELGSLVCYKVVLRAYDIERHHGIELGHDVGWLFGAVK